MWRVFSASATGQRNVDQGAAGQDASHCLVTGDLLVAIVCDGAGSAQEGRVGANFMARALAEQLSGTLDADHRLLDLEAEGSARLEVVIRDAIETVRGRLADLAASGGAPAAG